MYIDNQDAELHEFLENNVIHVGGLEYTKLPDIRTATKHNLEKNYSMNELYAILKKKYKEYYYEQKYINKKCIKNVIMEHIIKFN